MRDLSSASADVAQASFRHRWSNTPCAAAIIFFMIAYAYTAVMAQSTNQGHKVLPTGPTKAQLNSALIAAIKQRNADRVDDLLIRGANPNSLDALGTPAALLACGASEQAKLGLAPEDVERAILTELLEKGADVNSHDSHGRTLLIAAAGTSIEDPRLLNLILSYKPHIDQADENGMTPLMTACASSNLSAVRELLERGANINAQTKEGFTPIALSLRPQESLIAQFAVLSGGGPNAVFELLMDRGADVKVISERGLTLLMLAAVAGNVQAAEALIGKGADVNQRGGAVSLTALHAAIINRKSVSVNWLLAHGADPNLAASDGTTPLILAAQSGRYAIVERLLKAGVKLEAKRNDGATALKIAEQSSNTAIANQLKKAGEKE